MSSSVVIFIVFLFQLTASTTIKSVYLTPSNTIQDGATISVTHSECTVQSNEWNIVVSTPTENSNLPYQGYHLQIDLDNSWGFHPNKTSIISLTMHGTTLSPSDLDPIFSFSVNNNQYITHWLSFDNIYDNGIYPSTASRQICDSSNNPSVSLASGDIKACVEAETCFGETERGKKAVGGNLWGYYDPMDSPDISWPMSITTLNDPINHQLFTSISCPPWNTLSQSCGFGESFATNHGLQIYIAIDEQNEAVSFSGFEIAYSYDTDNPTEASQNTVKPSTNPTQIPSKSVNPTEALQTTMLTLKPSTNPTQIPSKVQSTVLTPTGVATTFHPYISTLNLYSSLYTTVSDVGNVVNNPSVRRISKNIVIVIIIVIIAIVIVMIMLFCTGIVFYTQKATQLTKAVDVIGINNSDDKQSTGCIPNNDSKLCVDERGPIEGNNENKSTNNKLDDMDDVQTQPNDSMQRVIYNMNNDGDEEVLGDDINTTVQ